MTTLWLRVEITPGSSPMDLAEALADASTRLGLGLMCEANGHDMMAIPGITAGEIYRLWAALVDKKLS